MADNRNTIFVALVASVFGFAGAVAGSYFNLLGQRESVNADTQSRSSI